MKKSTFAILFALLATVGRGAASSTSLVYVDTTARTLTGNIVAGNNTTISASGNGTVTATAAPLSGITGLGTGVGTFLATPSSANLASAVTGETGTGALVFATSPTLVTPVLGAATGTSLSLGSAGVTSNIFSVSGSGTIGNATSGAVTVPQLFSQSWYGSGVVFNNSKTDAPDIRNWAIVTDRSVYGDLHIRQSNALGGDPIASGTTALSFNLNRDATFAGGGNFKGGSLTVTNAADTANIIRSSDSSGNAVDAAYKATGTTYAIKTTDTGGNLITALTLDSSQNATFAGSVKSPKTYSGSGTVSVASGATVTLFAASDGMTQVFAYVDYYDPTTWSATATVSKAYLNNDTARIVASNTAGLELSVSGLNVQVKNNSGSTLSVQYVYQRMSQL